MVNSRAAVIVCMALMGCGGGPFGASAPAVLPGAATDLPQLAVTVAAQLEDAAGRDPARLAALELELRRISDALPAPAAVAVAGVAAPGAIPQTAPPLLPAGPGIRPGAESQPASGGEDAYPPAPELAGARSLFSALSLGAYPSADTARAAWFGMNAAHGEALAGLDARIETVARADGATAFVLKAGPFASAQDAETLCARLRQAGAVCAAGDFTGETL